MGKSRFEHLGVIRVRAVEEGDGKWRGTVASVRARVPVHEMGWGIAGFAVGDVQACFSAAVVDRYEVGEGKYLKAKFRRKLAEQIHSEGRERTWVCCHLEAWMLLEKEKRGAKDMRTPERILIRISSRRGGFYGGCL